MKLSDIILFLMLGMLISCGGSDLSRFPNDSNKASNQANQLLWTQEQFYFRAATNKKDVENAVEISRGDFLDSVKSNASKELLITLDSNINTSQLVEMIDEVRSAGVSIFSISHVKSKGEFNAKFYKSFEVDSTKLSELDIYSGLLINPAGEMIGVCRGKDLEKEISSPYLLVDISKENQITRLMKPFKEYAQEYLDATNVVDKVGHKVVSEEKLKSLGFSKGMLAEISAPNKTGELVRVIASSKISSLKLIDILWRLGNDFKQVELRFF